MGPTQSPIQPAEAPREFRRGDLGIQQSLARIFPDEEHSAEESREIIVGHSSERRLLLICFTESEWGRVRIIGARRAAREAVRL
jgi:uncharacterized DUF497 family protein